MQTKDYYPFGMEMTNGYTNNANATKYLYNGKELQDEGGLDFYDYGARFYDPVIGRWHSVDPLAENRIWCSPYQYTQNNPIMRVDTNGMEDGWVTGPDGNTFWDPFTNSPGDFMENYTNMGLTDYSYVGQTAAGTDGEGNPRYGDQYGKFHNSIPVDAVTAVNPVSNSFANIAFGDHGNWESGQYGPFIPDAIQLEVGGYIQVAGIINYSGGIGVVTNSSHTAFYFPGSYTILPDISKLSDLKNLKIISFGPYASFNMLTNLTSDRQSLDAYQKGSVTTTLGLGAFGITYGKPADAYDAFRYGPFAPTQTSGYESYGITLNPGLGFSRTPTYTHYFLEFNH